MNVRINNTTSQIPFVLPFIEQYIIQPKITKHRMMYITVQNTLVFYFTGKLYDYPSSYCEFSRNLRIFSHLLSVFEIFWQDFMVIYDFLSLNLQTIVPKSIHSRRNLQIDI